MNVGRVTVAVSTAIGLAAAAAGVPSGAAWAQQAQNSQTAQNADASSDQLQEVVVTAERRETDVLTTPISMTVTTGQQLEEQGTNNVFDLQSAVPNFTVNQMTPNNNDLSIRGLGTSAGAKSAGIAPGVEVIHDGLLQPETIGLGANIPFYDIQDVEVLKGPQGTLVGQSSTGGAVEINSRNPEFGDAVSGYIEGQWGNYSDIRVQGAINLPISDTLAARLAFNSEVMHSFYYDIGANPQPHNGQSATDDDPGSVDNHNYRLSILWKPTDNFEALFKASYNTGSDGGDPTALNQASFYNTVTGTINYTPFYANAPHSPWVLDPYIVSNVDDVGFDLYSLDLKYTLPDGIQLRSLSGYQFSYQNIYQDANGVNIPTGIEQNTIEPDTYRSQEIDVISPTTWLVSFIAGAEVFYRDTSVRGVNPNWIPPYSQENPENISFPFLDDIARNAAIFGTLSYNITSTLQLQVGARQNWDSNFQRGAVDINIPSPPLPAPVSLTLNQTNNFHDSDPTGKVGLNWTAAPGQFLYAFWAHGYRAGGVSVDGANFNPEKIDDYELGWKSHLFEDHLQVQLGGFWMNELHMQEQLFEAAGGVDNQIFNLTGPSKIRGLELSAQGRFGPWGGDFNLGYTKSTLGSISTIASYELPASATTGTLQCAPGQTSNCFNFNPYYVSLTGEQNPLSPPLSIYADVNYTFHLGDGDTLTPRLAYSYIEKQYGSLFEIPFYAIPSISLVNANLIFKAGHWTAEAYGTNLANRLYLAGTQGNDVYYGPPRQYGIRVARSF
jgi:iron complex outermembrane receptor protein